MKKILLFLLAFLACTYSAQAVDMKLACEASGWGDMSKTNWFFTDHGDGVWTFTIDDINNFNGTNLAGQPFKILDSDGKWYSFNDFTFNVNDSKTLYKENGNSYFGSLSGKVTLVITDKIDDGNPRINLLLTDGSDANIYLRGGMNGWNCQDAYKFVTTDGVTYTLSVDGATVRGDKGNEWVIANSDYSHKYGADTAISAAGTRNLTNGPQAGFSKDLPDGPYDLVYNYYSHVLTISNTDLYIVYKDGGWALDENLKFTPKDGSKYEYELKDVTITQGATFAIGNAYLKFGTDGAEVTPANTVDAAETKEGWSNNPGYGKWASTIDRNVNIVATLGTKQNWGRKIEFKVYYVEGSTPTPTPTYPDKIYLYGASSDMMTIPATDQENGVYEATLTLTENVSFRFYSDKNKPDDASYGPNTAAGSGYEAYTLGETKGMTKGSTNRWQLTNAAGEYKFTVDLQKLEFVVTAVTPTTYPDLWVRGDMTKNNWDPTEGYKMTCTDGVYTLENVTLSNTEFKIGTDETGPGVDWKYGFGAASDAEGVLDVTADGQEWTIYDVLRGNNLHIGEVSGTVDITFKPDFTAGKGTLTIKPHDTPVVGYKVYVVRPVDAEETPNIYCYDGFTNGSWPGEAMKRAENDLVLTEGERPIYVYTVESACKVIISTGEDGKGPWRYPADQATGVQINEDTIIIISENEKATYGPFDPSKVSGVNDVEIFDEAPVEFYNLQGVRVDGELTPGLYIRRQGGNASKILIR